MDPAVWNRIKDLAFEAMDLPPSQRAGYLDAAAGSDPSLRAEVEKLMRAHDAAEIRDFLDPPFLPDPPTVSRSMSDASAMVGTRIGGYKVRRLIGIGGMGAVYEAVQENPRRTVALKVMRSGIQSRSSQRRFEYESQLLARLRHPGIAQVYEAGAHEGPHGPVPYFAMEYIPGARPITEHAAAKKLSIRERLDLVARVCEAVHHGHQKGVVHRDLKPSNILVDSSGQPKIIDFGVALATDSDIAATTLQTNAGQLIGTLQYMSPEQAGGSPDPSDIDTRSDVYSVGVVLYELLTGRPPYDISKVAIYEAPRIIREQAPDRPSSIDTALRGDVEIITLKALEKDRGQRYQSAAELALDIRRWLAGEAIAARPPSVMYQLRVLTRRHRPLVLSGAAVVLALLIGVIVASVGLNHAIKARDDARRAEADARREAARAARIANFLEGTIGSVDPALAAAPAPGNDLVLDPDYSPWEVRRQSSWEYAGRPGQPPTALDLLRSAGHRLDQTFPDDPSIRGELGALIGSTLGPFGDWETAKSMLRSAVALKRQALGPDNESTIASVLDLASAQGITGENENASETYESAVHSCERAFGATDPRTLQAGRNLTATLAQLPGRHDEALRRQHDTVDLLTRRLGADHVLTLTEMSHLASLLLQCGHNGEAEFTGRRALAGLRREAGADRRVTMDASATLAAILRVRRAPGDLTEAEQLQAAAVSFYETHVNPDYSATNELRVRHAEILVLLNRPAEAQAPARRVLESERRLYGPDHLATLKAEARLARILLVGGIKLDEAETLAAHSALFTPRITSLTEDYAVYHAATLADARRARGAPDEGLRQTDRLVELIGSQPTNGAWMLAYLRGVRAQCLADLNRTEEARVEFERALAEADRWDDPASAIRVNILRAGARLLAAMGRTDESREWQKKLPPP